MTMGTGDATTQGRGADGGGRSGAAGGTGQAAMSGLAEQAAKTAEAQASTAMTRAGDTLDQVASAIRDVGNNLRDQQPQIAEVANTAAERVHEAASYLRQHNPNEVIGRFQDAARRQPAAVVAGGLAIGLILGRFLRAGSEAGGGFRGYGTRDAYSGERYLPAQASGGGMTGSGMTTGQPSAAVGSGSPAGTSPQPPAGSGMATGAGGGMGTADAGRGGAGQESPATGSTSGFASANLPGSERMHVSSADVSAREELSGGTTSGMGTLGSPDEGEGR